MIERTTEKVSIPLTGPPLKIKILKIVFLACQRGPKFPHFMNLGQHVSTWLKLALEAKFHEAGTFDG